MYRDLLLEIGTEEMPAHFLDPAIEQIYNFSLNYFKNKNISYKDIKVWATPRRLVLYVVNLAEMQEAQEDEIRGPAAHIAYKDGAWTEAAKKFVEQYRASLDDLYIKETPKGRYVFLKKVKEGEKTINLLPSFIEELLKNVRFPKMMRWGNVNFSFGRPIRWLVVLYGNEVVDIEIAGVKSSRFSRPPRFLPQDPIEIEEASSYLEIMRKNYVIVDHVERKNKILEQINEIAKSNSFVPDYDSELLDEVTYLVEYPTALIGSFEEKYLNLPEIVLRVTMEKKQRYFPLINREGRLVNKFIVIRNGTKDYAEIVIEGNEKVLKARLADAEYYYNEDIKYPLERYAEKLSGIIFQEQLGTIRDKVERVRNLVRQIGKILYLKEEELKLLDRAVDLYKADLGTLMVSEYPELHGIMGSIYAKISGERDPIPQIIGDYIYPRTLEDSIPKHPLSLVLSVADRVDSLVGYFALDLFPSGSEDPIGLRRITGGLLKILIEGGLRLNVREVLEYAWKNYNFDEENLKDQLEKGISFIVQRLRNMLLDKYPLDVVEAVINVGYEELWKLGKRLNFLIGFKDSKYYEKVVKALNRLYRILPQNFVPIVVKPELQISSYERRLYDDFIKIKDEIGKEIMGTNYNVLINYEFLGNFSEDIEAFFDNVLVMSPNEEERVNRLSLLWEIKTLLWEICDWSKLS